MNFIDFLRLSIPVFALIINVLIQIISYRNFAKKGLLNSEFFGFIIGFTSLVFFEFYISILASVSAKEYFSYLFLHSVNYLALEYCYFHFVNLGETARRIRILRELKEAQGGLTLNEILSRYNAAEILARRLTRLINNGQLVLKNNRYYINNNFMLITAKIISFLKFIFLEKKQNEPIQ